MQCTSCGFVNPEGTKFCGECGNALDNRCASCGAENPPRFKFCGECGTSLTIRQKAKRAKGAKAKREKTPDSQRQTLDSKREDERRQLTVMFCDLVGSTALSERLDPEELREVLRAYQQGCAEIIDRFGGYIAQYLGDGLLVYFGYPLAHEDGARRAVQAGLGILAGLHALNTRGLHPLQVRIGIHTGLVVVGGMGGGTRRDSALGVGETPNIAARLQGLAQPDTVVISAATYRLIEGLFDCQDLGLHPLKGISTPLRVYRVRDESGVRNRLDVALATGLTPLVGRAEEVALLLNRWQQVKEGAGQVVMLSGEPGIGKSRLVQELKERIAREGCTQIEFRCSPYHQNSAFYPIIEHLQRWLQFQREDPPRAKLKKLEGVLSQYRFPQADAIPLLAALLSLPSPEGFSPLNLSPQKQKQRTQETLVAWLLEEAERTAVYSAWEDLHWADPSTLELLHRFLDQVPATQLLILLTFRPEFIPPWGTRSHITPVMLSRLRHTQAGEMVKKVTGGKALPAVVVQQVVSKTDGVPLFVEELTKMVVESGLLREADGHYELTGSLPPLAIPTTLHDSLMARLDRLAMVKEVAQLGAILGREFSYELLQAVSPMDEPSLQQALTKLVEAEILYQRGLPPQTHYLFKHALIQEAAYQSLLKSKRQQYHRQIAQVLEKQFPETVEIQPELLAHHYTEAGIVEQALLYWQQAGQGAIECSATVEGISHLTKGLALLQTLPDTVKRAHKELVLQTILGPALMAAKGYAASEAAQAYTRAQELCQQLGETSQLFTVLRGLWGFRSMRAELRMARELGEQCLTLAQRTRGPALFLWAHYALGATLFWLGEFISARAHLEQGIILYDPQKRRSHRALQDPGVACLSYQAWALWALGYPDQALQRSQQALTRTRELSHPFSLAFASYMTAMLHQFRREGQLVQERADALITLSNEQEFPFWLAQATILQGWALAEGERRGEGITQIRHGLDAWRATGAEWGRPYYLALLAETYGKVGHVEEGLNVLAEALQVTRKTGERWWEAELYRLKGTLLLKSKVDNPRFAFRKPQLEEAERYFLKALNIARQQSAKSLELRAVMSLSRLWQQQGKTDEARKMLAAIYGWFTEGPDTADLKEVKALLEEL